MASISPHAKGYRAHVCVKGQRESEVFRTKREAAVWAARRETELRAEAAKLPGEKYTLLDALRKYGLEVSPTKRGVRWELVRLTAFEKDDTMPVSVCLSHIGADKLVTWRDARLKKVSPGSVLRDISLLSDVFEVARREWKWIAINPMRDVKRPPSPAHRDVVITQEQMRGMLRALRYHGGPCRSVSQAVAVAFLLALRTGMRAKEICELTWDRVKEGYCPLLVTKTVSRDVPISWKARRLIDSMSGFDDKLVFGIKTQTLDAMFRKYRQKAGLSGFTFHDSRHTAATWIGRSRKVDVLELCRMFGWSNPTQAMVYFNPKASDIAKRF